jgi:hypothetical protein
LKRFGGSARPLAVNRAAVLDAIEMRYTHTDNERRSPGFY